MRILPLLIVICVMLLIVRVTDIVTTSLEGSSEFWISATHAAQEASAKAEKQDGKDQNAKEKENADQKEAGDGKKQQEGDKEKSDEKPAEGEAQKEPIESVDEKMSEFSQAEIDLLTSLQERRKTLQEWERKLKDQERILAITGEKLETKLAELKSLKEEVNGLLGEYNQKEDTKIRSLVKIYESMKAKDAAKIFEELDMSILLIVADRMKEAKAAPVLAQMSPARARALTMELAKQRKLSPVARQEKLTK